MEIKQIIDALNGYYKTTPSLNNTEYCAYFGILKSLTPEQLQAAAEIVEEGDYEPIMSFFIQAVMHPQAKAEPVRNEKIDRVVGWFVNKKARESPKAERNCSGGLTMPAFLNRRR